MLVSDINALGQSLPAQGGPHLPGNRLDCQAPLMYGDNLVCRKPGLFGLGASGQVGQLGPALAIGGGSLLYAGIGAMSTLFTYGVARESKSKMVKIPGYIMAAGSAAVTVVALLGGLGMAAYTATQ